MTIRSGDLHRYQSARTVWDAFPQVFPPSHVVDMKYIHHEDYAEAQRLLSGREWWEITEADAIACPLAFLTSDAFRYYLPGFLIEGSRRSDVFPNIMFFLDPRDKIDSEFTERINGLTSRQLSAIAKLLNEAAEDQSLFYSGSSEVAEFWLKIAG